jgi:DNA primase
MGIANDAMSISSTKPRVQISCPLAPWLHEKGHDNKPSLMISYGQNQSSYFKCFACGESGKLWSLVDSFGALSKNPELQELATKLLTFDKPSLSSYLDRAAETVANFGKTSGRSVTRLSNNALRNFPYVAEVPRACSYLNERKVNPAIWNLFDLRYDIHKDRLVFPVRDKIGLIGAVGRIIGDRKDVVKYYNYFGFDVAYSLGGEQFLSEDRKKLMVVEGFICLLRSFLWCHDLGCDVVCTFHGEMSDIQANKIISFDKGAVIAYDNDKTGNNGWKKCLPLLKNRVVPLKRLELPPDVDIAKLEENEFKTRFNNCHCLKVNSFI